MGIECDGRAYHSAATARDRDRLRQQILESLGWRIHRIWSTDWWHDHDTEVERVHRLLTSVMEEDDRQSGESGTEGADARHNDVADVDEVPTREREEYAKASRIQPQLPIYRAADISDRSSSDFYAPQSTDVVRSQLVEAIRIEAPVCEEDLFQRVARAWG